MAITMLYFSCVFMDVAWPESVHFLHLGIVSVSINQCLGVLNLHSRCLKMLNILIVIASVD